jgi:hypothetical protein
MTTNAPKCNHCGGELAVQVSPGSDMPPVYYCPHPHPHAAESPSLPFDRLGELFALKEEHDKLLRSHAMLGMMRDDPESRYESFHLASSEIEICHRGLRVAVKVDPLEAAALLTATTERRLANVEDKMRQLGIAGVKRVLPTYDDLDPEFPF